MKKGGGRNQNQTFLQKKKKAMSIPAKRIAKKQKRGKHERNPT